MAQVIASAQLSERQAPYLDPTSLGNIARRAGVPDWNVKAALAHAGRARIRLGEALVQAGVLKPAECHRLLKKQASMRSDRPGLKDTLEMLQLAIEKTLLVAGLG